MTHSARVYKWMQIIFVVVYCTGAHALNYPSLNHLLPVVNSEYQCSAMAGTKLYCIDGHLNLVVESQIANVNILLAGVIFGGSVQDHDTYICEEESLVNLI